MSETTKLFIKSGTLGAEPDNFYSELAKQYHANIFSTDAVRLEIGKGVLVYNQRMTEAVNNETERRVLESLTSGNNTVYDGFLNAIHRRRHVLGTVAKPAGALMLGIYVEAHWDLIEQRLIERHETDTLPVPSHAINSLEVYLDKIFDMNEHVTIPTANEGIPVLTLDGTDTTARLLEEVSFFVDQKGN